MHDTVVADTLVGLGPGLPRDDGFAASAECGDGFGRDVPWRRTFPASGLPAGTDAEQEHNGLYHRTDGMAVAGDVIFGGIAVHAQEWQQGGGDGVLQRGQTGEREGDAVV